MRRADIGAERYARLPQARNIGLRTGLFALALRPKAAKNSRLSYDNMEEPAYAATHSMNKSDLIDAISKGADISKAAAGRALDTAVETITKAVAKGESVTLVGFGTFRSAKRAARAGKNPKTGEAIKIPAATVPRFAPGAAFKAATNGKKPKKK